MDENLSVWYSIQKKNETCLHTFFKAFTNFETCFIPHSPIAWDSVEGISLKLSTYTEVEKLSHQLGSNESSLTLLNINFIYS